MREGVTPPPPPRPGEVLFLQCLMAIEINKLLKMSLRESSLEVHFTDKAFRGLPLKYLNLTSEKAALVKAVECSLRSHTQLINFSSTLARLKPIYFLMGLGI